MLTVTPGQVLPIYVGQAGGTVSGTAGPGGYSGGGQSVGYTYQLTNQSVYFSTTSGGGGATDIRTGSAALADRVLVVRGGGSGYSVAGAQVEA